MGAYDMSFSHIENKQRLLCLKKSSEEKSIMLIANFSEDKEDVSDLLNGTKVLFKNGFNDCLFQLCFCVHVQIFQRAEQFIVDKV